MTISKAAVVQPSYTLQSDSPYFNKIYFDLKMSCNVKLVQHPKILLFKLPDLILHSTRVVKFKAKTLTITK